MKFLSFKKTSLWDCSAVCACVYSLRISKYHEIWTQHYATLDAPLLLYFPPISCNGRGTNKC